MLSFSRKSDKIFQEHSFPGLLDQTHGLAANDYNSKEQYDFRQIEVVREYEDNLPDVVCDSGSIQQVFMNILRNGAEAMVAKDYVDSKPRFILRIKVDSRYIITEIEDNGPGLDEVTRSRILEPFFTTKDVGKGTGLGLSLSYFTVTEEHGGQMEVESEVGEWSRFTLKLPVL